MKEICVIAKEFGTIQGSTWNWEEMFIVRKCGIISFQLSYYKWTFHRHEVEKQLSFRHWHCAASSRRNWIFVWMICMYLSTNKKSSLKPLINPILINTTARQLGVLTNVRRFEFRPQELIKIILIMECCTIKVKNTILIFANYWNDKMSLLYWKQRENTHKCVIRYDVIHCATLNVILVAGGDNATRQDNGWNRRGRRNLYNNEI